MPPHPVAGGILQVLVLPIATLHQFIERVAVEVALLEVFIALPGPIWPVPATVSHVIAIIGDITVGITLD
tara:strand:+ start:1422 stop:1631 length:210 start_codon:yes stop_codon:yes gene_type:complete